MSFSLLLPVVHNQLAICFADVEMEVVVQDDQDVRALTSSL